MEISEAIEGNWRETIKTKKKRRIEKNGEERENPE